MSKMFCGKKRNEIVDKLLGDVSQVWLNSNPSATSQQMTDRHVGQIVRRDGPAVKFWMHYSFLFVHVTEADSFHMREPTAPFGDSTLSRDQPVGNNTHNGWRTPETDSITLAGLFYFHNVVDENGIQSCCIFAVVTVYCPYGWRHHFNILFKKRK